MKKTLNNLGPCLPLDNVVDKTNIVFKVLRPKIVLFSTTYRWPKASIKELVQEMYSREIMVSCCLVFGQCFFFSNLLISGQINLSNNA